MYMLSFKETLQRFRPNASRHASDDHTSIESSKEEKGEIVVDSLSQSANDNQTTTIDPALNPGALSFEEGMLNSCLMRTCVRLPCNKIHREEWAAILEVNISISDLFQALLTSILG